MIELAWHFVGETLRDGSPIPADGEWLEYSGPVVMCESGLHASTDPFDALQYAPGPVLCRVEVDGVVKRHNDKLVCSRRRIVARRDVTDMLRLFARQCASDVLHLLAAPEIVVRYLATGDESIRASAWDASWTTASDASWTTASDAALAAARGAAWDDARDAAGAARGAAWATAWDAARAAAWEAARAAAREAARAAARAAQRERFNAMVRAEEVSQ